MEQGGSFSRRRENDAAPAALVLDEKEWKPVEQETSSLDTFKLPTDEQVERAIKATALACGKEWDEIAGPARDAWIAQVKLQLAILLNKDRILGYDRL